MTATVSSSFLRRVLVIDAVASGAAGLLLAFGSGLVSPLTGLPAALMQPAGMILLPYAAFVAWLGTRPQQPTGLVWAVIVANALWTLGSVGVLVAGGLQPNALGYAFVIAEAALVGLFAELQFVALKRAGRQAAMA